MGNYGFYSWELKKVFNSQEELEKAEAAAAKKKDARKEAADKVKAASDKANAARLDYEKAVKNYEKELSEFCSKYGPYKTSVSSNEVHMIDPFMTLLNFSFLDF